MNILPRAIYEFDHYRLDPNERLLWCYSEKVILRSKLFDLLVVLVDQSGLKNGRMLSYDDLLDAVWPDSEADKFDVSVNVSELRKIIGKQYIENVQKHGYRFVAEVRTQAAASPPSSVPVSQESDVPGGPVSLQSSFYVARQTDEAFYQALERGDGIVLVKGARQTGKTSLLARGLERARQTSAVVVTTDFQQITNTYFETAEKFLLTLAESLAEELQLETRPHQLWNNYLSAGHNFSSYLRRQVLAKIPARLVWGLDEADRLSVFPYASEVFGIFRSWHNERALDPAGPWRRLTLALTYATESHLFITDLNQSPFNVGTHLLLDDFTAAQVAALNRHYGSPLREESEMAHFLRLVGGHPHLAQCGLRELAQGGTNLAALDARADCEDGVFGNHLRQMIRALERDTVLCASLRSWLLDQTALTLAQFYRLRSAGILRGSSPPEARPRCGIYERYLKRRLA